mgnify:FL=1
MNALGALAYATWDTEFGDHSDALEREQQALLISGYYEANLGQLNILLNTNFKLNNQGSIEPDLKYEEKAIFNQIYLKDYYKKQSRNILRSAANVSSSLSQSQSDPSSTLTDWTTLQEGDTVIRRNVTSPSSKNETARIMGNAAAEANELLHKMIHSYNMYGSVPVQVLGGEAYSTSPTIVNSGEANY